MGKIWLMHLKYEGEAERDVRDKVLLEFRRGRGAQLWLRESRKAAWRRKHCSRMRIIFINCKGTDI